MRSFILYLLTVILIESSLAQMADSNSGAAFNFQNLNNERFEGFITSLEKNDLPFQIKTIPITKQVRLTVEAIGGESALPNIKKDSFNEFVKGRVYVVGPVNGGGGAFYHSGAIGKQAWTNQSQQAVKFEAYGYNLQGIEFDPYNVKLTVWKALTPDNEYTAQVRDIISQTGLALPQVKMTQTELETIIIELVSSAQYEKADFKNEAVLGFLSSDKAWSLYGKDIKTIFQKIIKETETGSIGGFYKRDILEQNNFIYVVGPGNGGGGTYMIHRK